MKKNHLPPGHPNKNYLRRSMNKAPNQQPLALMLNLGVPQAATSPSSVASVPPVANTLPPDSISIHNNQSSSAFRLNAQNLFLTYPRCPVDKSEALRQLQAILPLQWALVAQEHHQDGELHLHVAMRLRTKPNIRRQDLFDLIVDGKTYHGNYQSIKRLPAVIAYVRKSDPEPLAHGEPPTIKTPCEKPLKRKLSDSVAELIQSGASVTEVNKEHPGFVLMNLMKLKQYQTWTQTNAHLIPTRTCLSVTADGPLPAFMMKIVTWLNTNLTGPRVLRQLQLYIQGPPMTRKTSLLELLRSKFRVYTVPHEHFDDLYSDDYDLAVIDELDSGVRSPDWMFSFLDGSQMTLRSKGGQIVKQKRMPVILCSNHPAMSIFAENRTEAFITRLSIAVIPPGSFIDVEKIQFSFAEDTPSTSSDVPDAPAPPSPDHSDIHSYISPYNSCDSDNSDSLD